MLLLLSATCFFADHQGLIFVVIFRFEGHVEILSAISTDGLYAGILSVGAGCVAWLLACLALLVQGSLTEGDLGILFAASLVYLDDPGVVLGTAGSLLLELASQVLLSEHLTARTYQVLVVRVWHPESVLYLDDVALVYHVVHFTDQVLLGLWIEVQNQRVILPHFQCLLHLRLLLSFGSLFLFFHLLNLHKLLLLLRLELFQDLHYLL